MCIPYWVFGFFFKNDKSLVSVLGCKDIIYLYNIIYCKDILYLYIIML